MKRKRKTKKTSPTRLKQDASRKLLRRLLSVYRGNFTASEYKIIHWVLVSEKYPDPKRKNQGILSITEQQKFNKSIKLLLEELEKLKWIVGRFEDMLHELKNVKTELAKFRKAGIEIEATEAYKKSNPTNTEKLLNTSIYDLELGSRIKSVCNLAKIRTIKDLVKSNPKRLKKIRNCGGKTIVEIEDFLLKNGLKWKMIR